MQPAHVLVVALIASMMLAVLASVRFPMARGSLETVGSFIVMRDGTNIKTERSHIVLIALGNSTQLERLKRSCNGHSIAHLLCPSGLSVYSYSVHQGETRS